MALSIDSNHPLFLHPSDTPGVQLVSLQLTGVENYSLWSRTMRIALLAKNKLGFVYGSCRRDDFPDALQSQWEHCNALVLSWILNSVSPNLSAGIVFTSNVEAVWKDLKERFDKIDGSRVFFLHRSIATLVQGESSVSVYFTRLKLLWDEYTALVPFSFFDCEAAQQNSPLPTVNQAYSMIIQEELHRAQLSASPIETSVMFTTASKGNERRRFSGTCDYCNIKGHSRDRCYRLIGFSPDFKFNKKKIPPDATMVNSVHAADNDTANGLVVSSTVSVVPSCTSEQYHQILKLLSKGPPSDSSVNLAGTVASNLPTSSNSCVRWIIDTGATDHILSVFKGLQFHVLCSAHRFFHLPNGHTEIVTHVGSHRLNSELVLSNDLCNGMIKGIGRRFNGLYIFESKGATGLISNSLASTGFGHASALKKLSSYISDKFDENFVHSCNVCPLAKQTRISTHSGHRYFLTVVDDCTRMTWQPVTTTPPVSTSSTELGQSSQQLESPVVPVAPVPGYSQKEGVDYMDTFSPVVKLVTVRLLLAIASVFDWPLFQLDVYNAFLQGDLFEEMYMELPPGFCSQGENMFKMKDLGELKYFLGLEVMRLKEGILVNQRKYALELIEESGMSGSKPARTPLEQNVKLTTTEYDELCMKGSNENDELLVDKSVFQRLIGRLIYLIHTRPDITFAVHYLSQFMQQPKESHLRSVLRIVRYIKKSHGQGILMDSNSSCELNAYCDSDWAACLISRRSISGFCIKLGNSLVSWKSKKQNVIARSSAEAEYRSMATTTAELTWLNGLANELGLERKYPVRLHCDNKAALQIAANPVYHERTKHIEIDCHFVREKIQKGLIKTDFVSSSEQLADIFTKALGVQQHEYLVSKLGVKDVSTHQLEGEC
ncbi:vinorine synthase-like [Hibiscus syriacus]|uniref:Vinorine synthase-like n=1 Tax=Hibiscus syriacus TaxID=106335 RepID=A0A6A3A6V8_HIBSY|nr:vinorine synthase-like [Hibiscus syriacus]